ncbi:hypothetical protein ACEWY4_006101 [Coilia grayii]|uniref:C2H2-type domain-containing protein n=1 Tax=Coilia grayii TaxID=363190 RepID=A0ABD1KCR4_9TELE
MGHVEDFEREFTSVMENLLHSAVTKTTKLFETTVHAMKAELVGIRKQNDKVKDTLCLEQSMCKEDSRTRDIGVQCIVIPTQVERSYTPGSHEDSGDKTRISELLPGFVQDENHEFTLLFIKPEEQDMYDYTPACLLPNVAEDQTQPFPLQQIEAPALSQEANRSADRPPPCQISTVSSATNNPTAPIPQPGQELAHSAPVESPKSPNLNSVGGLPASVRPLCDTQHTAELRLRPSTPTSISFDRTTSAKPDHKVGVKTEPVSFEIHELSFGSAQKIHDQPRRTITRPSTSKYRRVVSIETRPHSSENIRKPNDTSPSTCSATSKRHEETAAKNHEQSSGTLPEKKEPLKSRPDGSQRSENQCEVCGFVASSASSLRHHWKVHRSERDCVCDKCGKICPNERSLTCHLLLHTFGKRKHHSEEGTTHRAEQADSTLNEQSLAPHQNTIVEQPRRLSARKSKSVYRRLVVLEEPKTENIQQTGDISAPTNFATTKRHSSTDKSSLEQLSRNQSDKAQGERDQPLKSQPNRSDRSENQCEVCGLVASNSLSLRHHWKVHRSERDSVCYKCGMICPNERSLTCHLLQHTLDKSKCRSEEESTQKTEQADSNMEKHSLTLFQNSFQQQSRRLSERKTKSVYRHRVVVETPQPMVQNIQQTNCNSASTSHVPPDSPKATDNSPRCLTNNLPDKKQLDQYQCELCEGVFSSASSLEQHQVIHRDTAHACGWCGKIFATEGALTCHILVHTEKKPHQCLECGKSFLYRYSLTRHQVRHKGTQDAPTCDKPFPCNICGKRLSNKKSHEVHTRLHMRIQTGEKPHKCSVCSKPFSQVKSLMVHMKKHNGEKPYGCLICGKRFLYNSSLTLHKRIHTGEMPYQCKACGKKFRQQANLNYHVKKHH